MKRLLSVILLAVVFLSHAQSVKVTVSMDNAILTNGGHWEGWGTSLCWWANRLGYNETLTKKIISSLLRFQTGPRPEYNAL